MMNLNWMKRVLILSTKTYRRTAEQGGNTVIDNYFATSFDKKFSQKYFNKFNRVVKLYVVTDNVVKTGYGIEFIVGVSVI